MFNSISSLPESFHSGLVSVVIPTFNRAHVVTETLDSVRNSTYRPIEIIVVDDGSTDDTRKVLTHWWTDSKEENSLTFKLISQAKGHSAAAARNKGLLETQGEYIHFLDSDDCVTSDAYTIFAAAFDQDACCKYIWGGWQGCDSSEIKITLKQLTEKRGPIHKGVAVHGFAGGLWSGVFKRSVFTEVGLLNERLRVMEDWEFQSRVVAAGVDIRQLWHTLLVTRNGLPSGRLSSSRATSDNIRNTLGGIEGIFTLLENRNLQPERRATLSKIINKAFWDEYVLSLKSNDHVLARQAMAGVCKTLNGNTLDKKSLSMMAFATLYSIGFSRWADVLLRLFGRLR